MSNEVSEQVKTSNIGDIWSDPKAFETAARMANALSSSTIVPKSYQGERGLGNCMIALEMANRLHTSPLMVMQNLYIVNGNPAWSSQYIIAMINNSKKYKTEIQFEIEGTGENMSCYAYVETYDGRTVKGPLITMKMAKEEGWSTKGGSKWKTMPEVMIRYRAASFFGRLNCPDMIMGMYSVEEVLEDDFVGMKQASNAETKKTLTNLSDLIKKDEPAALPEKTPTEHKVPETKEKEVVQGDLGIIPNFGREEGTDYDVSDIDEDNPF